MDYLVGIGDYKTTNDKNGVIKTYSLASCVGLTVFCPKRRASGMLHVVLPTPFNLRDKKERPYYFAETGVPLIINELCWKYGCKREDLIIKVFGGAESIWENDLYDIGNANIKAVQEGLYRLGLSPKFVDVRGNKSRSLTMSVIDGDVTVHKQPMMQAVSSGNLKFEWT